MGLFSILGEASVFVIYLFIQQFFWVYYVPPAVLGVGGVQVEKIDIYKNLCYGENQEGRGVVCAPGEVI